MRRRGWAVIALAAVVVLAGCSGFGADADTDRTPAPDRTTYGVPDRTTTTAPSVAVGSEPVAVEGEPVAVPVGTPVCAVGSAGGAQLSGPADRHLASTARVVTAHRRALSGCSFRATMHRTVRAHDGSVVRETRVRAAFDGDRRQFVVRRTHRRPGIEPLSILVWSDGQRVHQVQLDDGAQYDGRGSHLAGPDVEDGAPDPRAAVADPTFGRLVRRALGATRVVDTEDAPGPGGPTRYLVYAEGAAPERLVPAEFEDVSNLTVYAVLDAWGVVERLRISYVARFDGQPVTVQTTLRIENVGNTTVEIPREPGPG